MKKENVMEHAGELVLSLTEKYAISKANSLCKGILYEPKVPSKLRREWSYHEKNK